MPMYDFHCHACHAKFEKMISFSASSEAQQCKECGAVEAHRLPSAPLFGDPDRLFAQRKIGGFKDVLRKVHEGSPGSRLRETSSIDF